MSGTPSNLPPQAVIMQMLNGMVVSRCVSLAADLALADHLKEGPKDVAALAETSDADPEALYRVLRTLAGVGVFEELPNRQFKNSPLSDVLRSDAQGSVRQIARWLGHPMHWRIVADLDYSLRTGEPASLKGHPGKQPFEVISQDRSAQETFNAAMAEVSLKDGAAITRAYDFSRFRRIMDVGGGFGSLAMMIARSAPGAEVVVYDLDHVVAGAREHLRRAGLEGRVEARGGSFLDDVPGPVDLCVLRFILHNWGDDTAKRILANCREALSDGGRVLVCEMLVSSGPASVPARIMDIEMMAGPGGRERTEGEFAGLFEAAGLKLQRVIETPSPMRLLEAEPTG